MQLGLPSNGCSNNALNNITVRSLMEMLYACLKTQEKKLHYLLSYFKVIEMLMTNGQTLLFAAAGLNNLDKGPLGNATYIILSI